MFEFLKFTVLNKIQTKLFIECFYEESVMWNLELKKYIETFFFTMMSVLNEKCFEHNK